MAASLARIPPSRLVARILEHPELVTVVQALDAPVLCKLVEHVGLEDAGEIVALASREQLEKVFDEDLWKSRAPGEDASFDADRFALWLEVLMQAGEKDAVEKLASMDEDMLTLALAGQLLVVDMDTLVVQRIDSPPARREALEKALEDQPYEEIEELRVMARNAATWDPIVTLLVALGRDHHALVRRVLDRLCALSREVIEESGGLHDVLTSEETLASDVGFDREQRREREGYVAPSTAASFLRYAGATPLEALIAARTPDAVTRSHFRAAPAVREAPVPPSPTVSAFLAQLRAAGVLPKPTRADRRLEKRTGADASPLHRAMRALRGDVAAFGKALDELAYLVNVLVAASGVRAVEANDVVSAVCGLGLVMIAANAEVDAERLAEIAKAHGLTNAFHVGWRIVGKEPWTPASLKSAARRAGSHKG